MQIYMTRTDDRFTRELQNYKNNAMKPVIIQTMNNIRNHGEVPILLYIVGPGKRFFSACYLIKLMSSLTDNIELDELRVRQLPEFKGRFFSFKKDNLTEVICDA